VARAEPFLIDFSRSNLRLQDDEQLIHGLSAASKSAAAIVDSTGSLTLMAERPHLLRSRHIPARHH
jgi:hypothetical protein